MTDEEQVSQALAELWDIVRCRCHEAYTGRGLHDPYCKCYSTDALQIVTDRIEALTSKLAKAVWELERLGFDFESVVGRDLMQATLPELKGQDDE